ncbi:MAG: hypothetical protein BAJALOKI1v1_70003 [Promethearchaeota archaeon]|nr:MAG: hypothetical protein BAJALOKI1v1_70003 [Candidatus Lokiarchaeota archaeon]
MKAKIKKKYYFLIAHRNVFISKIKKYRLVFLREPKNRPLNFIVKIQNVVGSACI